MAEEKIGIAKDVDQFSINIGSNLIRRSAIEMLETKVKENASQGNLSLSEGESLEQQNGQAPAEIETKVQVHHMALALSKAYRTPVVETIQSLPQHQQEKDKFDKDQAQKLRKEKRMEKKIKWRRGREEAEEDEDGLSGSDEEASKNKGRVNKKTKLHLDNDDDETENKDSDKKADLIVNSISLAEQEALALRIPTQCTSDYFSGLMSNGSNALRHY